MDRHGEIYYPMHMRVEGTPVFPCVFVDASDCIRSDLILPYWMLSIIEITVLVASPIATGS